MQKTWLGESSGFVSITSLPSPHLQRKKLWRRGPWGEPGSRGRCRREGGHGWHCRGSTAPSVWQEGSFPVLFYRTGIGPMPYKAAAVAAGALQLAGLDGIHGVIIKFLWNFVAFICDHCYHILVCGGTVRHGVSKDRDTNFGRWGFRSFFLRIR